MNIYSTIESNYFQRIATRVVLVLITVAAIVVFLPHSEGPQRKYDIGKPWMYGTLIAQFDFPVYRSDDVLQRQRDSVERSFQPYYVFDSSVSDKAITTFMSLFDSKTPAGLQSMKPYIIYRMQQLYQKGIMGMQEYSKLSEDTTSMVRIVSGKEVSSVSVRELLSTMMAYEQLFLDSRMADERHILQKLNFNDYMRPNLIYDKQRSETELEDAINSLPTSDGMVLRGQKIIDRGEVVTERTFRELSSMEKEENKRGDGSNGTVVTLFAQAFMVLMFVVLFTVYLILFRVDYFEKPRSILMVYALIAIFPIAVSLMMKHMVLSVYILPIAMVAIFVRVFMDSRTAYMAYSVTVLLCAVAVKYQYEFLIVQLAAGLVAIFSLRELSKRAQLFKTAFFVVLTMALTYYALQLMQDPTLLPKDRIYIYFIANGILLLLAYPLMYIIERTFGFVSSVTLFELSDTNRDLLRQLSEAAPGTFQHSIMVSNLASAIANRIGAKGLLVRTGALYHDIGKMQNPVFFTENQAKVNPHDALTEMESAQIITGHVEDGLRLAEKYNLPKIIRDFISTHHGDGVAKYFYIKYKNEHPDEDVDMQPFSYPGPNPFTREQAILMMADAVEAASRSLKEYTEESISELVNRIVDGQVESGAFKVCPITFRDIEIAKHVMIDRLKTIYHTRISYPSLVQSLQPIQ